MKLRKLGIAAAAGLLALSMGLVGCSGGSSSSSSAATGEEDLGLLNDGQLTILMNANYPPFENRNMDTNEVEGYEWDLFQAVANEMGLELVQVELEFDGIMPAIVAGGQGDIGVSGFSVTPERAEEVDFTTAFFTDDMAVAVMKDSGITEENAREDLNQANVKIAVQLGTTGEDFVRENFPNAEVMALGDSNDIFAALQAGQATAACTNLSVVADEIQNNGYDDAEIVLSEATSEDYAAIVSKDNPALLAAINNALQTLADNGTIAELQAKWFK